jgi:hypothetical protein
MLAGILPAVALARPAAKPVPDAAPAPFIAARVIDIATPGSLILDLAGRRLQVAIRGVHADPLCLPQRHLAWARRWLPAGTPVELGLPDRWGGRSVRFIWQGAPIDWGFLLLRAGQAFPGAAADDTARLPTAYLWAAREARAEGRGLWGECGRSLARFRAAAARTGVPTGVLYGVAMVESAYGGAPWPWTLNIAGQPRRFATRLAAWRALRQALARGQDRVDIGLMQVNWHFHHQRFRSSWEALDPEVNRMVAAGIIVEHWQRSGALKFAVAHYHSADPERGARYLGQVARVLNSLPSAGAIPSRPVLRPSSHPRAPAHPEART